MKSSPPGEEEEMLRSIAPLKYQKPAEAIENSSGELLTVKLRYIQPDGNQSELLSFPLTDTGKSFDEASAYFRFASAVAAFDMILRDSDYRGEAKLPMVLKMAKHSLGEDRHGFRRDFIELVNSFSNLR